MDGFPTPRGPFRLPWRRGEEIRREVDEEIAFHLDMRAQDLIREGLDANEARRQAQREFGDVEESRKSLGGVDEESERTRGKGLQSSSARSIQTNSNHRPSLDRSPRRLWETWRSSYASTGNAWSSCSV